MSLGHIGTWEARKALIAITWEQRKEHAIESFLKEACEGVREWNTFDSFL